VGGEIEGGGFQLRGGDAAVGGKGFHAALEVVGAAGGVGISAPGGLDLAVGVVAGEVGGDEFFVKGQAISPKKCWQVGVLRPRPRACWRKERRLGWSPRMRVMPSSSQRESESAGQCHPWGEASRSGKRCL
jgi:hypothetical protein